SATHEDELLSQLIDALTRALDIPKVSGGSVTCKRRKKKRGFEPDECFWIANEPAMRGKDTIDMETDPPPDLGLEIDITSSSINRMGIYAAMRVPEVWRIGKNGLTFNALQANGKYAVIPSSLAFPGLTPADLMSFLSLRGQQDENSIVKAFSAWVRQRFNPNP
ncbi:MAG TPA: Uma2 family endonuclease, partial [Gemmataceae bacterium]|nr:Uma2 family endonuclease [Gemmataceae bacterium]